MVMYSFIYHSIVKEGPLWIVRPCTTQFCINFLLRSKTYMKEHPPSAGTINRDFQLSSKLHVVALVYTYKVQITLLHSGLH